MNPRFAPLFGHVTRLDLRSRQLPLPGVDRPVRPDRRADGRLYRAAARLRSGRGQARPEGAFPRPWHDARRADARASGRPARIPRRCPRHPARPGCAPTSGWRSALPGCRAASSSSPTPTSPMPAGCSRRSASASISPSCTTSTPPSFGPSPTSTAMSCCSTASASTRRRAAMVEDMAQNLKPAKELGMTTVWVDNGSERGNHGHHPDLSTSPSPMSANGSRTCLETMNDRPTASDHRGRLGAIAMRSTPATGRSGRRSRRRSCGSTAARSGSRKRSTASGGSTSG